MIGALVRASLASLLIAGTAMAESKITLLDFSDLNGWAEDDHAEALAVFRSSCSTFTAPTGSAICAWRPPTWPTRRHSSKCSSARS